MSVRPVRDRQVALLEVELGRRAAGCLLVESGQAPAPGGYTPRAWIARIALDALRANGIRAHKPCAKTVRAALKAAGLGQLVTQVTTSRRTCRVRLRFEDAERTAEMVTALRPLWHDGAARVDAVIDGWSLSRCAAGGTPTRCRAVHDEPTPPRQDHSPPDPHVRGPGLGRST